MTNVAATQTAAPTFAAPAALASVRYEHSEVGRIVIDRPDDKINAIDADLIGALSAAIADARAAAPRALIVTSTKPGQFVAGADFNAVLGATAEQSAEASRAMQRVLDDLASLPFVTVAAINGNALGGGCEIALACDWRIAADLPSARIGQSEVQLGLLPAAGGTQRLPRLVGLVTALDLILNGRRLSPRRALRLGLVDEVVHPAALEKAALDRAATATKRQLEGGRTGTARAATHLLPARAIVLRQARSRVLKETRGHYPAPLRAIEAIGTGLASGIERGLEAEARAFGDLASGTVSHNLIDLFLLGQRQRRAAFEGLPRAAAPSEIAVVGAGLMGSGIAQVSAIGGADVRIRDVDTKAVARGLGAVRKLTTDASRKGVIDRRESARAIARVTGTTDYSGFHRADLVIEAVFEELATKRKVIAELEAVVREDAVIASNTSALPIAEIARGARHPERIVGMHFFSPVHRMPLVEVVHPAKADPAALARVVAAGQAMGKTVIVVGDGPGFYTTRTLGAMMAEATQLLAEGARIEDVDRAWTESGWPIGPLALLDEVGLAVARHAGETVAAARGITSDRPNAMQVLTDAGLQGKRGGGGFYRYDGGHRQPNPRAYELLRASGLRKLPDVAERLVLVLVNEAARCLDEGVLRSPVDGDLGAVLGFGFPPYLGGPFRYADARGAEMRDALRRLADRHGERYAPARCLADGRRFYA